jgi:hypothetical protein
MPKRIHPQHSFSSGELSPRLYARQDIDQYKKGLRTATNAIVTAHGPVLRRAGTQLISPVKDHSVSSRLIPFEFSKTDTVLMEFGNQIIRFYTSSGQVLSGSTSTISSISTGSTTTVTTSGSHGLSTGDQVVLTGIVGTVSHLNTRTFTITVTAGTTFTLDDEDTTGDSYSSGGTVNEIYEVTSPYGTSDLDEITYTQFGDKVYLAHPSYAPRVLERTTNSDWSIEIIEFTPPPTKELGDKPLAALTPGATTGLGVTFTTDANPFLAADVGRQIINLSGAGRASIVSITASDEVVCDIIEDFPSTSAIPSQSWKLDLSPIAELTPSGFSRGSIINITADDIGTTTAIDAFNTSDVGKFILMHNGVVEVTEYNSASDINGFVWKSLDSTDETSNWTLEDPAWDSTQGWPRAVGLFQERLVFGGTSDFPQTLWMSQQGLLTSFGRGAGDGDAISVDLSSGRVNNINWLATSRDLSIGTSAGESTIDSGSSNTSVTPKDIRQIPRTYLGSSQQAPLIVGSEVIFYQTSGLTINSFRYNFDIDNYISEELTFPSEHIVDAGITELAFAQRPDSIIYGIESGGDLVVGMYKRDQAAIGWCKWTTEGSFERVGVIGSAGDDQVYVVVNRTINGNTRRTIELLDDDDGTGDTDLFSDSSLVLDDPQAISGITAANPPVVTTSSAHGFSDGDRVKLIGVGGMTEVENTTFLVNNKTSTTFELQDLTGTDIDGTSYTAYTSGGNAYKLVLTVTGLSHLEGEAIALRVDGGKHAQKTVSQGRVTLDDYGYKVVAGLPYTTTIETLDPPIDFGIGLHIGRRARNLSSILLVKDSAIPQVNGVTIPAFDLDYKLSAIIPLYTGKLEYTIRTDDRDNRLTITTSDPLPLKLLGIYQLYDGHTI